MANKQLMRTWYPTDVKGDDPDYVGAFSAPLPDPKQNGWEIVAVDWSEPGQVCVTYLIPHD
jgi:hypothetical protein